MDVLYLLIGTYLINMWIDKVGEDPTESSWFELTSLTIAVFGHLTATVLIALYNAIMIGLWIMGK